MEMNGNIKRKKVKCYNKDENIMFIDKTVMSSYNFSDEIKDYEEKCK